MRKGWKLTEEEKELIPILYADGVTITELAESFGVSRRAIKQILERRS